MRTKVLLLTAALSAAGVASSMAQVYSANAVGYVNLSLKAGFNLIANPLNGTNNHLNTILPLPDTADGTTVYRFNPATQNYSDGISFFAGAGWFLDGAPESAFIINPGEGFFIQPSATTPTPLNVTFVGEVPQGALSNPIQGGNRFSIVSSQVPQALPLGSTGQAGTLQFPAADGDTVYVFDADTQAYKDAYQYFIESEPPGWFQGVPGDPGPVGPTIPVGTSFFVRKSGGDVNWTRNFSVN